MNPDVLDPCGEIQRSSAYVREWMKRQPAVKEESLTDWLLYRISQQLPYVYYHAFNRIEEGRVTGADWEWWILFPSLALRLRVQAKKAFEGKDNYREIARTNQHGLQIDKLIEDADAVNAIPLYALFSSAGHPSYCHQMQTHPDGVYLAGAKTVYDRYIAGARARIDAADLIAQATPFSCFACCPLTYEGANGAERFAQIYFPREALPDEDTAGHAVQGLHRQLPSYVDVLLSADGGVPEEWEREFSLETEGVRALLVYDFRDRPDTLPL